MLNGQEQGYITGIPSTAKRPRNGGACAKPRGITDAHLIPGAKIVTAAMVVEAMAKGASMLGF